VLTNYVGELLQHDTSYHLFAPFAGIKWYLITTIDDYSRKILYADLWEKESSWAHIFAMQYVVTQYGCPLKYYVDNHSIFRFVERRDSMHKSTGKTEENATVQWKEVLKDLGIEVDYAQSAPAKGKIERPFQWLQDHTVRTCYHEKIIKIEDAREILFEDIHSYNYKHIHSTTREIPAVRYENALNENKSLFRKFSIRFPYEKLEDIFCYRIKRIVNRYRKISLNKLEFSISGVPILREIEIRISFDLKSPVATLRFWYQGKCVGQQQIKIEDLKGLQF